jgi:hypothetical protein
MNADPVQVFGHAFCVIDSHNLFVCATLEDELLVLGADAELFGTIQDAARPFHLHVEPRRRLDAYSGGERTIICALLLAHVLPPSPRDILFVHALESLSRQNRATLLSLFASMRPEIGLFNLVSGSPERLHG